MAFFLEATFVGIFFFGWERLSKAQHMTCTWLLALGTNLSALWILIANGWMQNPVGAYFDYQTMRMEISSFYDLMFNPVAKLNLFILLALDMLQALCLSYQLAHILCCAIETDNLLNAP